jgi:glucose/arabinose dehydrogenase
MSVLRAARLRAALILAAAAIATAATSSAQDSRSRRWDTQQMHQAAFDVQPGGTLRVKVPDGNVEIETGAGQKLTVDIELAARDLEWAAEIYESMDWVVDGTDGKISVRARNPRRDHSWWGSHHGGYEITIKVRMPQEFNLDLDTGDGNIRVGPMRGRARLETSDGDIDLESLEGSRIDIDTSDGDVEVASVQSPDIHIETSDGTIFVGQLDGGDTALRTSDGDIVVEESSGALRASTSDGDIRVRLARFDETSLRSGDGDIHIDAPDDLKAELDLRGERLSLRSSSITLDGKMSKTSARGALNGGGPRLSANTRGGRIVFSNYER